MANENALYKRIVLYISFGVNIVSFFVFYLIKHRSNSKFQTAFMINSIFHSSLNYLNLVLIHKTIFTKLWSKFMVENFYQFLHADSLYHVSNHDIFPIISVILLFEIFICLEIIQIVKSPINTKSFRINIFIFIMLIYLISMNIYSLLTSMSEDSLVILIMFYIAYPLLILIAVWTIMIIFIVHSTASLMLSNLKLRFCIMQCCSIWFTILTLSYPFYLSLTDKSNNQSEIMFFMNICSLILNCFRLTQVKIVERNKKKISNTKSNTELFSIFKLSNQTPDWLIPNESNKSQNEKESNDSGSQNIALDTYSPLIDISVLSQNNFLSECFVYLISGLLQIATIEAGKKIQYNIKPIQYLQSRSHKYKIENKVITDIATSVPRRRRFWNHFAKQFKIFSKKVQLIEYAPEIFRNIRTFNKIKEQELKISFDLDKNIASFSNFLESEGKSGSLFFVTYDYKYIFKTISERERKTLTHNFLQPYYELLAENNSTLLSRIYGAYVLNIGMIKLNFILMENISPFSPEMLLYKFDLKGSELGRSTKRILQNTNKTLKDLDYAELVFKQPAATILINDLDIPRIKENLIADLNFLEKTHLMDYSLFIAITENRRDIIRYLPNNDDHNKRYFVSQDKKYIYLFGIIDYLTKYDKWKNLENKYLRLRHLTGEQRFSAIEPSSYRMRFYTYLVSNVFITSKQRDLKIEGNRVVFL